MGSYKVEICGVNTGKLKLIPEKEKETLLRRIQSGDQEAREEYMKGNLRLVLSIVGRFAGSNENMDDLFQIGCIGLMKAIDHFDLSLQVCFSTYAVPMILGEVRRYLRDNNSIRVSRSLRDTAYRAVYTREMLRSAGREEPTMMEVAKELGIQEAEVKDALDAVQTPLSLYEPVFAEGNDTLYLMDQIRDQKEKEDAWIEKISLKDAMKRLEKREKEIIRLRYYEGKTQMEVAMEIGISQAQVSRLEKSALTSMRNYLTD